MFFENSETEREIGKETKTKEENKKETKEEIIKKLLQGKEITKEEASKIEEGITKANPRIPYKHIIKEEIGRGHSSIVYEINYDKPRKLAAKIIISNQREELDEGTIKEYAYLKLFYKRKRKVPKPKGIFNVYDPEKRIFKVAIVMEKIEGKTLEQIINENNEKLEQGVDIEEMTEEIQQYLKIRKEAEKETRKLRRTGHESVYLANEERYFEGITDDFDEYFFEETEFPARNIIYEEKTGDIRIIDFGLDKINYKKYLATQKNYQRKKETRRLREEN